MTKMIIYLEDNEGREACCKDAHRIEISYPSFEAAVKAFDVLVASLIRMWER